MSGTQGCWQRIACFLSAVGVGLTASCAGSPSTVDPRGPHAANAAEIWWVSFWLAAGVFALVTALLAYALFRRRPDRLREPSAQMSAVWQHDAGARGPGQGFVVFGGIILPILILVPLSAYWMLKLMDVAVPGTQPAFTIEVTGYQFWWHVRYPNHEFVTANEIHIPVGQPVRLVVKSADVIHSFWVPQLMGKHDMIPGKAIETWIQADEAGVFWGECAEYCGVQHAKMAFVLVAEPPDQFRAWTEQQQRPAAESNDPLARRGAQVFAQECIACHAIKVGGQTVGGAAGPDLTHFGSRRTVGAGILPNIRGNVAGWVGNPQAIKPGNNMPIIDLDADSLLAVVAYLESLK
ncbi:MAG: cytochrome c oxidase subunit II [Chloroflexota bacterium]